MDKRSAKYTTQLQFNILLEEMGQNPNIAKGNPPLGSTKLKYDDEWERIREKLNSHGPPIKSTAEWKRVWTDLKFRTKKKLAENAREFRRTDTGDSCMLQLTPVEQEVEKIFSLSEDLSTSGNCHNIKTDQNIGQNSLRQLLENPLDISSAYINGPTTSDAALAFTSECPSTSTSATLFTDDLTFEPEEVTTPPPKKRKDECLLLLRDQTGIQKKICTALDRIAEEKRLYRVAVEGITREQRRCSDAMQRIAKLLETFIDSKRKEELEAPPNLGQK